MQKKGSTAKMAIDPHVNVAAVSESLSQDTNIVFIGGKPLVNYIKGIEMQFTKKSAKEVWIKSRGKFISKAVDVVEVAKRSLEQKGITVKTISIGSETFEIEGKVTNVSTMDILMGL